MHTNHPLLDLLPFHLRDAEGLSEQDAAYRDDLAAMVEAMVGKYGRIECFSIPIGEWKSEDVCEGILLCPSSFPTANTLFPGLLSGLDVSYLVNRGMDFSKLPHDLLTNSQWVSFYIYGRTLSLADIPDHIDRESFYLECLQDPNGSRLIRDMPADHQSEKFVSILADKFYLSGEDYDLIRPDLRTPAVIAKILTRLNFVNDFPVADVKKGMKWLIDNGYRSLFERWKVPEDQRSPAKALELAINLIDCETERDWFQIVEEIRRIPIDIMVRELRIHLNSLGVEGLGFDEGRGITVIKEAYGVELALRHLKELAGNKKREWAQEALSI